MPQEKGGHTAPTPYLAADESQFRVGACVRVVADGIAAASYQGFAVNGGAREHKGDDTVEIDVGDRA